MADYSEAYQQYKSEEAREQRLRAEVGGRGMTDERLCKCGHFEADHTEVQAMDLDGRPTFPPYPYCYECQADDRDDSAHPFEEAAPSTDEGEAQWAREIADGWVNSATAEDRETVVLTECEKHPGVMPEWSCPICVRAPLEERIQDLQRWAEIDHANLEARAQVAESNQDFLASAFDADGQLDRLQAEVERLRKALRKIVRRVEQPSASRIPPLIAIEAIANGALATPSSTEGTDDEPTFDRLSMHRSEDWGTKEVEG